MVKIKSSGWNNAKEMLLMWFEKLCNGECGKERYLK